MKKVYVRATKLSFSLDGTISDYFWVLGNKETPPLLLIHGYTGTHSDLLEVADILKEKYFVIVPDLPGWWKSPRFSSKLTIRNYAIYLKLLLDYLGISKATIVGHSMGAAIAIEIAYTYPNLAKSLILISTPYLIGTRSEKLFSHLAKMAKHSSKRLRPIFFIWRIMVFDTPSSLYIIKVKSFRRKLRLMWHYIKIQPQEKEDSVEENFLSGIHYDYNKVKEIKAPIHLIHGLDDVIVNRLQAIKFHQLIPYSTIDFIPHSGHMPPVETPESLASLILKYS